MDDHLLQLNGDTREAVHFILTFTTMEEEPSNLTLLNLRRTQRIHGLERPHMKLGNLVCTDH
jgi:hypothetical protein